MKAKKTPSTITIQMTHAQYDLLTQALFEYCESLQESENVDVYAKHDALYMGITKKVIMCDHRHDGSTRLN